MFRPVFILKTIITLQKKIFCGDKCTAFFIITLLKKKKPISTKENFDPEIMSAFTF